MVRKYENFTISVRHLRDEGSYEITAECLGLEPVSSTIPEDLPTLDEREIELVGLWLERGRIDPEFAKDFGTRLFQTLFTDEILVLFRRVSAGIAPDGLRITLEYPLPPALVDLPWELLYDADGEGFLARSADTPVVRHLPVREIPHRPPDKGPLRVLVVTASPKDRPSVSVVQEPDEIARMLKPRSFDLRDTIGVVYRHLRSERSPRGLVQRLRQRTLVDIDILSGATKQKLQHELLAAKNAGTGYHVVHFIGHGSAEAGVGTLLLLDEDGNSDPITAKSFSEMMDEPTLNLVMFNACETAVPQPFMYSVAEATLDQGVPAVIGMQAPVPDHLAVDFARDFYGAWANGEPIESALAYARQLVVTGTPGTAADWVIPVLYMSPTEGLALELEQLPKPQPLLVRAIKNAYVLGMALFTILGLIFFEVPQLNQAIRTKVPVIQCVFPYEFENKFVVAVSKFIVVDEDGSPVRSQRGEQLADELYSKLARQIGGLNLDKEPEVRPPDETCPIRGLTYADRESAAAKYADRSDTNVIVYGVITDTVPSKVALEFYVNYRGFKEGQEVTGKHELGEPLSVYDFEAKPLRARVFALNFITIGLSHYVLGEFEDAIDYFKQAEQVDGWLTTAGKEVVYLLLGNSLARMASREKSPQYSEQALAYYDFALEECNPEYARAKVGQAGMYYLQALGDPDDPSFDQVDEELLDKAEATYQGALTLHDAPESAHIPTKVDFNLGQIYIVRAKIHEQNPQVMAYWLQEADSLFEKVIHENESGNVALEELVGHAYAKLALVAFAQGDRDLAIEHQARAIGFFTNFWHGHYAAVLGDMYAVRGQKEQAREAYKRAIQVAKDEGDQSSHDKYTAKLEALLMDE